MNKAEIFTALARMTVRWEREAAGVKNLRERVERMAEVNTQTASRAGELQRELSSAQASLNHMHQNNEALTEEVGSLRQQLFCANFDLGRLEAWARTRLERQDVELDERDSTIEDQGSHLRQLQRLLDDATKGRDDAYAVNRKLVVERDDARKANSELLAEVEKLSAEPVTPEEIDQEINNYKAQLEDTRMRVLELNGHMVRLTDQTKEQMAEIGQLKGALSEERILNKAHKRTIAGLRKKIRAAQPPKNASK